MIFHLFQLEHHHELDLEEKKLFYRSDTKEVGWLEFQNAEVRWFLSIDLEDVPEEIRAKGQSTYRSVCIDGSELEFSEGFTDLHRKSYEMIVNGNGFGVEEAETAIRIVSALRDMREETEKELTHPLAEKYVL